MAKQIVREYDNSTGNLPSYSNFSVLVPGYVHEDKTEAFAKVSDDNDVYEVSSAADFLENVGQVAGTSLPAIAPKLAVIGEREVTNYQNVDIPTEASDAAGDASSEPTQETTISITETEPVYIKSLTVREVYEYVNRGVLYEAIAKTTPDDKIGHLEDNNYHYQLVTQTIAAELAYETIGDVTTTVKDDFCVIEKGNEGQNEKVGGQIGNQIAYKLLQLGYTVLYKGFGTNTKLGYELADLRKAAFWKPFRDKSIYSFRYVMSGGDYDTATMNEITALAEFNNSVTLEEAETILDDNGRGDIIALCDVDESKFDNTLKGTIGNIINTNNAVHGYIDPETGETIAGINGSKYSAIFAPRVIYALSAAETEAYDGNNIFPASFHYLACAAYVHSNFAEWYAVAGYNRGISALPIVGVTVNYGNVAQNTLGPRVPLAIDNDNTVTKAINLIITERGNYYLWGNRTSFPLQATGLRWSHYLNIRQLCTTIKKQVIYAGRMYAFDPNSDILWINFRDAVEPLLQKMEGDQGINGHKIVPVKDRVKGALKAKIRIVPIEAVEDFDIGLYLDETIPGATVDAVESD